MSKKWINGILTTLVAFVFLGSAVGKFMADAEALKMAESFGLDATTNYALGVLEIVAVLLFILPRTGVLGTLLLAAYMGGAIATHLRAWGVGTHSLCHSGSTLEGCALPLS